MGEFSIRLLYNVPDGKRKSTSPATMEKYVLQTSLIAEFPFSGECSCNSDEKLTIYQRQCQMGCDAECMNRASGDRRDAEGPVFDRMTQITGIALI